MGDAEMGAEAAARTGHEAFARLCDPAHASYNADYVRVAAAVVSGARAFFPFDPSPGRPWSARAPAPSPGRADPDTGEARRQARECRHRGRVVDATPGCGCAATHLCSLPGKERVVDFSDCVRCRHEALSGGKPDAPLKNNSTSTG